MENGEKLSLSEIKKRVVSSFMSLTARQIILRAVSFITLNIILAKALPVATLGIFNVATSVITFFAFFSDIGLAASLIQKKEAVTDDDVKTVFTVQQLLVTTISLIIIIGAPWVSQFYGLDGSGTWLVRILGFSFFLSSLKVVPSVLLERNLKFGPLVTVEVVETLIFNGLLILLVLRGVGLWSFTYAAFARGIAGTSLLYILSPTPVGISFQRETFQKLLSFGLPFQLNSLLAMLKDRLVPLVVARMIGASGVGYITWAQGMAFLPLEVMNMVIRITFPAFSRMQEDKQSLTRAVEKSLFTTSLLVYPILFGIGAILPSVVTYVVSAKWQPAVNSFYLFAFSAYWAVISSTFTNTLNAIGHIKITLRLMVMWTILTWVLTPILVFFYGFVGVALTSFLISFTSVITIFLIKRVLPVKVLDAILLPTAASAVMGCLVFVFAGYFVRNIPTLSLAIIFGGIIYSAIIFLFGKNLVIADIKSLKNA